MVTVSTSSTTERSYHHGDLRSALIEAGLRHLESGGEADISLRQLARETGVSATAVYRHFPDKKAHCPKPGLSGWAKPSALHQRQREAEQRDLRQRAAPMFASRWPTRHYSG
jgi:AcrR family transcriptional regulator